MKRHLVAAMSAITVPSIPVVAAAHSGHGHAAHRLHYLIELQHVVPLAVLVGTIVVAAVVLTRRRGHRHH
jgi:hypothetical protein